MGGDRYGGRDRGHLRPGDLRHPVLPRARCVGYPYTSRRIAELFPEQYLWIRGDARHGPDSWRWSRRSTSARRPGGGSNSLVGLSLTVVAAAVLMIDYFVQVTVMQPSLVKGQP
jgi:hypothetical protein